MESLLVMFSAAERKFREKNFNYVIIYRLLFFYKEEDIELNLFIKRNQKENCLRKKSFVL